MNRLGPTLLCAALAFTATGAASPELPLCSILPFPDSRDPRATYILGVGQPDTMFTGPGAVVVGDQAGHWGQGQRQGIYGQVVAVQRLAGADSARIAEVLAGQSSEQVLVVPWDYDAMCQAVAWSRSARFAPLDSTGTFSVRLRAEEHWPAGIPTFDAFIADMEPYPQAAFFRSGYRGTDSLQTQPSLTAGEFFELSRGLPDQDLIRSDPAAAETLLEQWIEEHPHLAEKYPAPRILERARASITRSRQ